MDGILAILVTDAARIGTERMLDVVEHSARAAEGRLLVLVREPGLRLDLLRPLCRQVEARVVEGTPLALSLRPDSWDDGRVELLRELGWGRAQFGGGDPRAVARLRRQDRGLRIGYSAHASKEAAEAFELCADWVTLSPVFAPLSKQTAAPEIGIEGLRSACSELTGPVYALGGIEVEHTAQIRRAGAQGVAAISLFSDADDPAATTVSLFESLE